MQNIQPLEAIVSPIQLGKAVGVSQSTIKRWVDQGRIKASRTAGGHRRIHLQEALRFVRDSQMQLHRPELLLPALHNKFVKTGLLSTPLDPGLLRGDFEAVQGILIGSYLAGRPLHRIWDELLAPALERIGELWKHDQGGILIEHRAIDTCLQVIYQIRSLTPVPPPHAPRAIGAALEEDPYMLPSLAASMVLAEAGWSTTNYGPLTPTVALAGSIETERPSLVWVSCSRSLPERKILEQLLYLAKVSAENGACLVTGGRALPDHLDLSKANIYKGNNMRDLSFFAKGLAASAEHAIHSEETR